MSTEQAQPVRPTAERMAQGGIVQNPEDRGGRPKPWHHFETTHDGLFAANLIGKSAWEAANLFRETWEASAGVGVKAVSWERGVDGRTTDYSERAAQAKLRMARWGRQLSEPLYGALVAIVGVGNTPATWAVARGEHPTCGRIVAIAAMEQFALVI